MAKGETKMPPVCEYSTWMMRSSDAHEKIEPKRKYVFICEGRNTEERYFRAVINRIKDLDLDPRVDIRLWEKTEDDKGLSNPMALVRFAHKEKENEDLRYVPGHDFMVIVFDADIYCRVGEGRTGAGEGLAEYQRVLDELEQDDIPAVTNPSFELFLLLHQEGAYERTVLPHAKELLENRKVGSKRYVQTLFTSVFNMNPKKSLRVGTLAKDVDIAIAEERGLNQEVRDANLCLNHLTCNIGSTIKRICDDTLLLD